MENRPRRCLVLLSGGLDSLLAARFMLAQSVGVEAIYFRTWFADSSDQARVAAELLGVPLNVVDLDGEYVERVQRPRFGIGAGLSPCLDCRIVMFSRAKIWMKQLQADFLVSGEVLGQRGWSQKRRDLRTIAYHAGVDDLLLRPLSAQHLSPTLPEREGWVDRSQLGNCVGQGRKRQLAYARRWSISYHPAPSRGCALVKPVYADRLVELLSRPELPTRWDCQLLELGRHLQFDQRTRVIVGRNEQENRQLQDAHRQSEAQSSALLGPENFTGPSVLLIGPLCQASLGFAAESLLRHTSRTGCNRRLLRVELLGSTTRIVLAAREPRHGPT